jgi:type VI secretion system protein ImpA
MVDARTHVAETAPGAGDAERGKMAAEHEQLISRVRVGCADQADKAPAEMAAMIADGRAAAEAVKALEATLAEKMAPDSGLKFTELSTFLTRVVGSLERGVATATKPGTATAASTNSAGLSEQSSFATPDASRNGQYEGNAAYVGFPERLTNRDDVVKCLDLIIAFYDRTEPSSPIPHLARRVRRMVHMDFLELMEDLAPSGLKEFRMLAGVADGKKTAPKEGDGR